MKYLHNLLLSLVALLLFCPSLLSATDELISDDYNRNSMSVIIIDRGDRYDSNVWEVYQSLGINNRFDKNIIDTKRVKISEARNKAIKQDIITAMVKEQNIGKQILSYWYDVSYDGAMNTNLIAKRSNYNATDEEAYNAAVSKIGLEAIGEEGYELINNSFVMVVDVYNIRSEYNSESKQTSWVSTTTIWVYKLNYTGEIQDQVWAAWQFEDDDYSIKLDKKAAYDSIIPEMKYVNFGVSSDKVSENYGGLNRTIRSAYTSIFEYLVSHIPEWQVTLSIAEIHPIKAKVGKKEGIKNTDRFEIFEYVEDENGNLTSESIGFMRAARVKDNRYDELGDTQMSAFYQISGRYQAREGMTIKENDDQKFSLGLAFTYGGLAPLPLYVEKLIYISPQGFSLSLLLETGITPLWGKGGTCWDLKAGFGLSFRPVRWVEIMPYAQVGFDYNMRNFEDFINLLQLKLKNDQSAVGYEFGVRVTANVKYPMKVFLQATAQEYNGGRTWSRLDRWYNDTDIDFFDEPLSLSLGVKYDF